jgi:arsenate reductase (thioredoxin)
MEGRPMKSILFLCTGNACRSQMAEGFAREMLPAGWQAYSAGRIAAGVHSLTIETMREAGLDISAQTSKTVEAIPLDAIDYVVTLCGSAQEHCPVFPRAVRREHWPIEDPISAASLADIRESFRRVRDEIRRRVEDLARRLEG